MENLKFYVSVLKYSILDPPTGVKIFHDRLEMLIDRMKNKNLHRFNEIKSKVPDMIKQLFPEADLSQVQSDNLSLLQNDIKKFMDSKKNLNYPSKELPYPLAHTMDDTSSLLLYSLCKIMKPEKIVETGVANGKSTSYILQALNDNNKGTLYSIDPVVRPWQSVKMVGSMIPNRLKNRWKFVEGESSKKLEPLLRSTGSIDIFYHDSLHTYKNMMYEFRTSWPFIKKNGILISDDIYLNDAFYDFSHQVNQAPLSFLKLKPGFKSYDEPRMGLLRKPS